jgi:hypothetical protein
MLPSLQSVYVELTTASNKRASSKPLAAHSSRARRLPTLKYPHCVPVSSPVSYLPSLSYLPSCDREIPAINIRRIASSIDISTDSTREVGRYTV